MRDLIHKGELFNALANAHDKGEIFAIIQDMQTVDAVPVVRCKDYRFCRKYKYREDVYACLRFSGCRNIYDYCSYAQIKEADFGERKNDG